ncbi:hypothetical protein QYM36_012850, partial [Artemia franciscana]
VDNEIEIKAYYAGHVLGAAMFHIKVGTQSLVYTVRYCCTQDIKGITKLKKETIDHIFSFVPGFRDGVRRIDLCGDYNMTPDRHLGAAWIDRCRPDLLISESTYATTIRDSKRCRERDFLKKVHECVNNGGKVLIPVFALGRAQELCILLETYWERMDLKVPIYFAAGLTEKLIMPGYCVQGTVGAQVLGGAKKIEIDRQTVEVKLSVEYMSFSAHADAKGIMQLIQYCQPKNVLLVHGEGKKMDFLKKQIQTELGIDCFMPANGETAVIKTALPVHAVIDQGLLMKCKQKYEMNPPDPKRPCLVHGVLVVKDDVLTLMDSQKAADELGLPKQELILSCPVPLPDDSQPATALAKISNKVQK